jgi:signal transduction histidine kinase/ligand-binding sensor domain-containing protein
MLFSGYTKISSALVACLLLFVPVFTNFLGQNTQPSPTPTQSPQPSPTATGKPLRKPTPTPVPGAQNFHQWGSITLFNGLPSDSVRAIAQTLDGVMWFGTDNGLARFDGRQIQNFSFGEADANRILVLKTGPTGQLWIGTQKGAFVYYESRFQPIEGTEGAGVTAILLDGENFLATDNGFVMRVTANASGGLTAENVFPNPVLNVEGDSLSITSLIKKDGKLLAGTSGRGVLTVQDGSVSELLTTPRPVFVNSLVTNASGKLWFGTDAAKGLSGIYSVENGSRAARLPAPTANVLALEANESGLWAGTERYGLFHLTESKLTKSYTFENTSGGLRSNTIFALFTDREGVVWIGTNRGVSRFDPTGPIQQNVSDSPNSNFIRALFTARKDWGLAGSNRGLFLSEGGAWKPVPGFDGKVIHAIAEHHNTELLIGTSTGLFDFSGKLIMSGDIRAFSTFQSRTYAAVFGRGVIGIPPGARGFGLFNPAEGPPPAIYSDESTTAILAGADRLWIGTAGRGLFSFAGQVVKSEARPDVLKSGTIWKMFSSADGTLWIAGEQGVFRLQNGQVEQIIVAEDVRDVFVSGTDVWAATTTRGLLHARQDKRFGWLVSAIGFEQGLPSEKAFSLLPVSDGLLIATNRGVVTYRPGTIAPKLIPTRILSQRMHDLGEIRSTIELDYPQNSLLVEVAGLSSRTFPEEFQYSFLLKNSRGDVIDSRFSNDPQYAPTDLSSGDYSVESVAYNRDLLSSESLTIRFSIARAPFPWTATALGILLVIAVIALIWAMIERRRIAFRNSELAAARFDLANEAERERSRIARDLHDQTLADLRNLMMMSDQLTPGNPEFRSEIESVSTEIRRICEDLSPSVLENVGLVSALEFLLSRSVKNHRFSTNEDANELVKFPVIVQLHIYRIAQEVITNITRHSDASLVEMSVEVSANERFILTIGDDGSSFQPDDSISKGRGISNIRSRASIINAEIAWNDRSGGGNLFSLEIAGKSGS